MATSKIDICNSALSKLGVGRISSFSETSKAAVLCNLQYDKIRKKVLRAHLWNFAMKRQELAALASAPLYEYSNAFLLPSDCLRPVETHLGTQADFVVEGKSLLINSSTCKLLYISDITDVSFFDSNFEEALAFWLAADLSYSLKQSDTLRQSLMGSANKEIAAARSYDAQVGRLRKKLQEDVWLDARIVGTETP